MQSCVNKFKTQQVDQEEIKTLINNYYLLIEYTKEKQKWLINNHHGFGFAIISILQLALLATLVIYFLYTLGMANGHLYFWQTKLGDLLPKKLNINNASIIKTYFKKCNNVDGKEIFSDLNIKKLKANLINKKLLAKKKITLMNFLILKKLINIKAKLIKIALMKVYMVIYIIMAIIILMIV